MSFFFLVGVIFNLLLLSFFLSLCFFSSPPNLFVQSPAKHETMKINEKQS